MALKGLNCAAVPLRIYSLTHSLYTLKPAAIATAAEFFSRLAAAAGKIFG